jgi:hypothetical protein
LTEICYLHPGKITDLLLAYRRIAGDSLYSSINFGFFSVRAASLLRD